MSSNNNNNNNSYINGSKCFTCNNNNNNNNNSDAGAKCGVDCPSCRPSMNNNRPTPGNCQVNVFTTSKKKKILGSYNEFEIVTNSQLFMILGF
jgi:hypothetical protein